jgi:hypothetical protein
MTRVSTGIWAHDVSSSFRNVSRVGVFVQYTTFFIDSHMWRSGGGVNSGEHGDTEHYLFVLSIDPVQFDPGSFWHLGGSVVVRHLVENKMAYSFRGDLVNSTNSTAEEAGLVAVQGLQGYCLGAPCIILIVLEVPLQNHAATVFIFRTDFETSVPLQIYLPLLERQLAPPFSLSCHSIRWLWHSCD